MCYRQEEGGESSAVFRRAKLNLVDLAGSEKVTKSSNNTVAAAAAVTVLQRSQLLLLMFSVEHVTTLEF
jgi:hypothetical protein